jgi:hypothetical protein
MNQIANRDSLSHSIYSSDQTKLMSSSPAGGVGMNSIFGGGINGGGSANSESFHFNSKSQNAHNRSLQDFCQHNLSSNSSHNNSSLKKTSTYMLRNENEEAMIITH